MPAPKARMATIPAPVGGWNARDPITSMRSTDAVILENMIPGPQGVSLRGGSVTSSTGLGAAVTALLTYNAPSQAPRLFAATASSIFDVTAGGAVGAAAVSGQSGGKWQGAMFGTPGGSFLCAANGTDAPLRFDGASWVAIKWASMASYGYTVTPSKLMAPCVFGSRLWMVETNSLRVWFKPVNQVDTAPAAGDTNIADYDQCLDLSSQCRLGGALVAMGVWTRDGGQGSDDYAVFLTSAGEILMYQGNDPTNVTTWSRVGLFRCSPPVGPRPLIPAGADIGVLTQTGLLSLSSMLPLSEADDQQAALSDKISGAFQQAYAAAPAAAGWAVQDYPKGALVLVNVPQADGTISQFAMNTITRAWCCLKGLPATCWGLLGDALFFGTTSGTVVRYDVLNSDDGAPINALALPAFSSFKSAARKRFLLARPLYTSALGYAPPIKLKLDYDTTRETLGQPIIPAAATPWGSPWGSPWGPVIKPLYQWKGVQGVGLVASVLVSIASVNPLRLDHIDLTFEVGGIL